MLYNYIISLYKYPLNRYNDHMLDTSSIICSIYYFYVAFL